VPSRRRAAPEPGVATVRVDGGPTDLALDRGRDAGM